MNQRISELIENAKLDDSQLFSQLLSALSHKEKKVVIGASLVLGRLGDERAETALIRAFLTTDQEIGAAVAWALGRCHSQRAVPFLAKAIEKNFAAPNSCEALGCVGNEEVLPVLLDALKSANEDVRACAVKALGDIYCRCSIQFRSKIRAELQRLLKDPSRKVRICVCVVSERTATDTP